MGYPPPLLKVIQGHRGRYQSKACMRLPITAVGSRVWSATRLSFKLDPLPTLHCRFAAAYQVPPAHATYIRGRHSNLRVLPAS